MSFIQWLGDWLRKVSTSVKSITVGTNSLTYTKHNNDTVTIPLTLESDLYVKKAGDTVTGNINSLYGVDGFETVNQFSGEMAGDDLWALRTGITGNPDPAGAQGTTSDNGFLEIATADNGTEPIYISQYEGDHMLPNSQGIRFHHLVRRVVLLDEQGNTSFPGVITASRFNGTATNANQATNANYATNAGTASKLGSVDVGSATQPIYLNDGVPTACTYQLLKTVPADAKFTDTVYTHPTTSGNKHIPSGGSSGQILRWSADGTAVWGNDNNTTYGDATTSASGLMSNTDKSKLDNLPAWSLAASSGRASGSMIYNGYLAMRGLDNTSTLTLAAAEDGDSSKGAKLYLYGTATDSRQGEFILQAGSARGTYKQLVGNANGTLKWDGVSIVNQNAFANVKVGTTTIKADSVTDTIELVAGNNVTLTPDATNDKITISATDTVYTHPTSAGNKHIPSGGSSGQILIWSASGTATWNNPPFVKSADISIASQVSSVPYSFKFKHPSGLMIQAYYNKTLTTDSNGRVTWTYDEAFKEEPFVQIQKLQSSQDFNLYSINSSRVILRCNNMSGTALSSGTTVWFNAIAIGRWK